MQPKNIPFNSWHYNSGSWELQDTKIISEAPVALTVNGEIWLTFQCTPTHLEALAIGFLYNEGFIRAIDEIANVRVCDSEDNVDVWMHKNVQRPPYWKRTSGCSGGVSNPEEHIHALSMTNGPVIPPEMITAAMHQLFLSQELYRESRGVHCSAISDGEGTFIMAEDIGRHNTLDKLAGRLLLENPTMKRRMILTTGRISSEMLSKAANLNSEIVISRTSPTSLSIQTAKELGITLIGYARGAQFIVYTHARRIVYDPSSLSAGVDLADAA